jgi:hypothetical protein
MLRTERITQTLYTLNDSPPPDIDAKATMGYGNFNPATITSGIKTAFKN